MNNENIECFKDTQRLYRSDIVLKNSIENSLRLQCVYSERGEKLPELKDSYKLFDKTTITVSKRRTLQAAKKYAKMGVVCILNFASSVSPGGGVLGGSTAQEESICRVSTLYPCLCALNNSFYKNNIELLRTGKMDARYSSDCIYTPNIVVFKSDDITPELLEKYYMVDVVTCAAPNLRANPSNKYNQGGGSKPVKVGQKELLEIHMERGRKIITSAVLHGCDSIVLGAFGCGAFQNPPNIVAEAYRKILPEFKGYLENIEFAIYCKPGEDENYTTFNRILTCNKGYKEL